MSAGRKRFPRPKGRIRWRWPLAIGFLADAPSRALRDDLYATEGVRTNLTQPEVGAARSDLLLLPYGLPEALNAVRASSTRPEATCVVLLTGDPTEPDSDQVAELAAELTAWGIVVVALSASNRADWFKALLAWISHNNSLARAFEGAAGDVHPRGFWRFGPKDFFASVLLTDTIEALRGRMMASADDRAIEIPQETAYDLAIPPIVPVRDAAASIDPGDLSFIYEREGATKSVGVSRAARPVIEDMERRQASTRFILTRVRDHGENRDVRTGFRAGGAHDITVWIGPKDRKAIAGKVPFPDEKLPRDANGHRLTIVFVEPDLMRKPQARTIELPAEGRSDAAVFSLRVPKKAKRVEARIVVLHRGRILQTALLRGPVLEPDRRRDDGGRRGIKLLIEAVLRPGFADLDDRQRFDAAVILNHSQEGTGVATLLGDRKMALLPFGAAEAASKSIGDVFFEAEKDDAFNRRLGSERSLAHLRRLAGKGTLLYDAIGKKIEAVHGSNDRKVPYIQILSANPSSFLPVELIYELPTPSPSATLCPNTTQALRDGRCEEEFHKVDEEGHLEVVCLTGFWGVTKVIERHAVNPSKLAEDPRVRGVDFLAVTEPVGDRKTLTAMKPLLFAASDHVNDVQPKELARVTKSLRSLTDRKLLSVDTWKEWADKVKVDEPPVLLLLSHTAPDPAGAALEINKEAAKQRRSVDEINEHCVNVNAARVGPVVLLIGCDTGVVSPEDFQNFVAQFKDKGASLVVGTIAPILGRHASRTAEALIRELKTIGAGDDQDDRGVPFGAVLRQIRRNLLDKGILISLALTSYGDADWRLATSP
jgi:hypothetical protein